MFKRLFWLTVGSVLGFSGSLWAQRRFRQQIERYKPEQVAQRAVATVQGFGRNVRDAAREGREAQREREETLRAQYRPYAR